MKMIQTPRDKYSYDDERFVKAKEVRKSKEIIDDDWSIGESSDGLKVLIDEVKGIISRVTGRPLEHLEHVYTFSGLDHLQLSQIGLIEVIMFLEAKYKVKLDKTYGSVKQIVNDIATQTNFKAEEFQPMEEVELFKIDKEHRFLTEIRRFRVTKDFTKLVPEHSFYYTQEGDIFEEVYDEPNKFINITKLERDGKEKKGDLKSWNEILLLKVPVKCDKHWLRFIMIKKEFLTSLEKLEPIDVLQSSILNQKKLKKNATAYKRKMKSLAKLNEDLTALRHILQIDEEETE